jgi:hypothetical protein
MRGGEPSKTRLGARIRFKQFKHRAEVLTQSRKAAKPQREKSLLHAGFSACPGVSTLRFEQFKHRLVIQH